MLIICMGMEPAVSMLRPGPDKGPFPVDSSLRAREVLMMIRLKLIPMICVTTSDTPRRALFPSLGELYQ